MVQCCTLSAPHLPPVNLTTISIPAVYLACKQPPPLPAASPPPPHTPTDYAGIIFTNFLNLTSHLLSDYYKI